MGRYVNKRLLLMLSFPSFSFASVAVSPRPTGRSSAKIGSGGVEE
jgi:hypothetical protein